MAEMSTELTCELTCEPVDILVQREPVALKCNRLHRASMAAFRRRLRTSYPAAVHPHAAFRRKDFAEPFIAAMELLRERKPSPRWMHPREEK